MPSLTKRPARRIPPSFGDRPDDSATIQEISRHPARSRRDCGGDRGNALRALRRQHARGARSQPALFPAALCRGGRPRLLVLPPLPVALAFCLPAGPFQHLPRDVGPDAGAPRRRLRSRLAEPLRLLLFRQDHDRALLARADVPARRAAPGVPLFQVRPHAPHARARHQHADPAARPSDRHRDHPEGARIGIGEEAPAARHPFASRRRPRPIDSRRARPRHLR